MNLRHLQTFVAVADTGGLRRAAGRVNLSQPAISRQLHALEAELGVRLFDLIRRRVQLTSEGEDLLQRGRRLLSEVEAISERARALKSGQTGVLRVGATPQFDREHDGSFPRAVSQTPSRRRGSTVPCRSFGPVEVSGLAQAAV